MATTIEGLTQRIDARLIEARAEQDRLTAARDILAAIPTGSFEQPKRRGRPPKNRVQLPELDAHLSTRRKAK